MNKQEIIDALNAKGVTFDPAQTKAELAALLGSTVGKPGEEAARTPTTGAQPAGEPEKPADDKPAEAPPADVNFVPPGEQAPEPVIPQAEEPADDKTVKFPSPETAAIMADIINGAEPATTSFVEFIAERETLPEAEILAKVKAGLSREQAVEVLNSQRQHDGLPPLSASELNEARDDSGDIPEAEIIAKMKAGLTRPQAIEVIHNQRAHDEAGAA